MVFCRVGGYAQFPFAFIHVRDEGSPGVSFNGQFSKLPPMRGRGSAGPHTAWLLGSNRTHIYVPGGVVICPKVLTGTVLLLMIPATA